MMELVIMSPSVAYGVNGFASMKVASNAPPNNKGFVKRFQG
jgi:hypothetical protein